MREYLFRGKDIKTKEWVYGYYCEEGGNHGILIDTSKTDKISRRLWVEVISETVGQYIEIKDDSKKKIFGGDIIQSGVRKWIVKWVNEGFWLVDSDNYGGVIKGNKTYVGHIDWIHSCNYKVKIIGNMTDNPELIGGKE